MATILYMTTLSLATARNTLPALIRDVEATHDTVAITRNGTPVAILLSVAEYESIMETLAVMSDPELRKDLADAEVAGSVTGEEMGALMDRRMQRDGE